MWTRPYKYTPDSVYVTLALGPATQDAIDLGIPCSWHLPDPSGESSEWEKLRLVATRITIPKTLSDENDIPRRSTETYFFSPRRTGQHPDRRF